MSPKEEERKARVGGKVWNSFPPTQKPPDPPVNYLFVSLSFDHTVAAETSLNWLKLIKGCNFL